MTTISKFRRVNGSTDIEAAIRAGHVARTDAIRQFLGACRGGIRAVRRRVEEPGSWLRALAQSALRVSRPGRTTAMHRPQ